MGCKRAFSKPVVTFLVYLEFSKWYIWYTRFVFSKPVVTFPVYHMIYAICLHVISISLHHSAVFIRLKLLNFCELFNAFKVKPSVGLNALYCVIHLTKVQHIDLRLKMSYNSSMEK